MNVAIVGIANPIGRLLEARLRDRGDRVVGIDPRHHAAAAVVRAARPDTAILLDGAEGAIAPRMADDDLGLRRVRAFVDLCDRERIGHAIVVGRHTHYGAIPDGALYRLEDEPPLGLTGSALLAPFVAADLYAAAALQRVAKDAATHLRIVHPLGPRGVGSLARLLNTVVIPAVIGFDPLIQFLHEDDLIDALTRVVDLRPGGVFNVTGPAPLPWSVVVRETHRRRLVLPEALLNAALSRLSRRLDLAWTTAQLKHAVVVDGGAFVRATGFSHRFEADATMAAFATAFPPHRLTFMGRRALSKRSVTETVRAGPHE